MERIHKLKVWPEYWDALASGEKKFEVRRDDRGFQRGDILALIKTEPHWMGPAYATVIRSLKGEAAHVIRKRIGWILTGGQFGIEPGYVVMSLEDIG